MKVTIYGIAKSRAIRNLWACEELGLAYTHVPVVYGPEGSRKPDFLAINPNGRVPAADIDGVMMWESLAINLHLAKKAGGPLAPGRRQPARRRGAERGSFAAQRSSGRGGRSAADRRRRRTVS